MLINPIKNLNTAYNNLGKIYENATLRMAVERPILTEALQQAGRVGSEAAQWGSNPLIWGTTAALRPALEHSSKKLNIPALSTAASYLPKLSHYRSKVANPLLVSRLVPQVMNPKNIAIAKALVANPIAKRSASVLGAAEVANALARANSAKTKMLLDNTPKNLKELLDEHKRVGAALESAVTMPKSKEELLDTMANNYENVLKAALGKRVDLANTSLGSIIADKGVEQLLNESVMMNPLQGLRAITGGL